MVNHLFFSEDNIITGKASIPKLARDIIHFLLILLASTLVFSSIWGFDLGNMLAALGVGSFVIGLALQEPLGNLFNGIALLIAKPFENGDWIEIGEDTGKVVDFNWRSAKILNRFNEMIIIPNNILAKERLKNLSRPNKIHADLVEIGFSYNDDPVKVKEALVEIAIASKNVLSVPEPVAIVMGYKDFYINYGLKFFINDYADQILLKDEMMTKIYAVTKDKGLTIPFPIREVHMKNMTHKN
jgi:small-conductance mechanosensitive channel